MRSILPWAIIWGLLTGVSCAKKAEDDAAVKTFATPADAAGISFKVSAAVEENCGMSGKSRIVFHNFRDGTADAAADVDNCTKITVEKMQGDTAESTMFVYLESFMEFAQFFCEGVDFDNYRACVTEQSLGVSLMLQFADSSAPDALSGAMLKNKGITPVFIPQAELEAFTTFAEIKVKYPNDVSETTYPGKALLSYLLSQVFVDGRDSAYEANMAAVHDQQIADAEAFMSADDQVTFETQAQESGVLTPSEPETGYLIAVGVVPVQSESCKKGKGCYRERTAASIVCKNNIAKQNAPDPNHTKCLVKGAIMTSRGAIDPQNPTNYFIECKAPVPTCE